MSLLRKIFVEHPASVNENYFEHLGMAASFGFRMLAGGGACLIHGLIPFFFKHTGSGQIRWLHDRMLANRTSRLASEGGRADNDEHGN